MMEYYLTNSIGKRDQYKMEIPSYTGRVFLLKWLDNIPSYIGRVFLLKWLDNIQSMLH